MLGIHEKIKSLRWNKFEVFEIEDGIENPVGDQETWDLLRSLYEVPEGVKLIAETENELKFLVVQPLMNEVKNGQEIVTLEKTLLIRKT